MHAHHHHHHPSKNVPSSNNRLSFPSNPRNPYSLNINFIYTCISSDALKFRYTFLHHHTQRTNEGRKERRSKRSVSRGKVRQEGKKNPPCSPRSKTMETGKTIERQARGSLSLPNAHTTFVHEKPIVLKFNRAAASRMPLSSTSWAAAADTISVSSTRIRMPSFPLVSTIQTPCWREIASQITGPIIIVSLESLSLGEEIFVFV